MQVFRSFVELALQIDYLLLESGDLSLQLVDVDGVTAERVGYWAARGTAGDLDTAQAAAALGLDEVAARRLMARFGRRSPYR
ncbi:hypothetical protein ACFWCB_09260 [Streptomyces sp. NPDC060048]|uniref:hypothetical protein n=1 Tax=unclassified Streptomyces TaxID=2593676 RepID=UPI00368A1C06